MKKILFICSLYHPHVGGIETAVTELASFYRSKGIASIVLTKKWPLTLQDRDTFKETPIYRVISARTESEFELLANEIKSIEKEIKSDIIHVIGVRRPLPLIGLMLSRKWGVPIVSTIAGSEIPDATDPQSAVTWSEGRELMEPVLFQSDKVTCFSESLKINLKSVLPTIKDPLVLYAGIDARFIDAVEPPPPATSRYILSLRRLFFSKGVHLLIEAFKIVSEKYSDMRLIIAGEGPEESSLRELAKKLGLDSRIEFIGTVDFEKAVTLLKGAVCTVVPSLAEGGGLVNTEAQAAGCPVVASDAGGIPEYIGNGMSGLLFKSGDSNDLASKLLSLLGDDRLRDSLIKNGKENAAKFDWRSIGPRYLELYAKLIESKGGIRFMTDLPLAKSLWSRLNS